MAPAIYRPEITVSFSRHPLFRMDLQFGADTVVRSLAARPTLPDRVLAAASVLRDVLFEHIKPIGFYPGAATKAAQLDSHTALEVLAEAVLEPATFGTYEPRTQRAILAFFAAVHLIIAPLPVGNWGGFSTPEIVGCPTCVRNHLIRWVRLPTQLARASMDGLLDPDYPGSDEAAAGAKRWIRLTWHIASPVLAPKLEERLTAASFTFTQQKRHQLAVAIRPLVGHVGKAMRFGETAFAISGVTWYGAETFYSRPPVY